MTSKERIRRCLNFEQPDRIGIYDVFLKETVEEWRSQGLPKGQEAQDYFGHDFETVSLSKPGLNGVDEAKFISISIYEPFTQACKELGMEETLKKMAYEIRHLTKLLNEITTNILENSSSLIEKFDNRFDAIWLYGDLAYKKGLFFSLDLYKKILLPLHKEVCNFFQSKGFDIIFHSDGDIRELLPIFIELGIKAVEPLETDSGLDVFQLRREFGRELVLFGNIGFDKLKSSRNDFSNEVEKKIGFLKREGGYIYRMDKDITPDIKFDDYKFAIELIKQYGGY